MDYKDKKKTQDSGQATQSPWTEFNRQNLSKSAKSGGNRVQNC